VVIRWNSWNHFGCHIQEELIRETGDFIVYTLVLTAKELKVGHRQSILNMFSSLTADAMVSTGLAALGYKYVNLGK
jgi:hypothetical protein